MPWHELVDFTQSMRYSQTSSRDGQSDYQMLRTRSKDRKFPMNGVNLTYIFEFMAKACVDP